MLKEMNAILCNENKVNGIKYRTDGVSKEFRLRLKLDTDRPVRAFSKWFVRNGAKPSIHPRREAQKFQNTLL